MVDVADDRVRERRASMVDSTSAGRREREEGGM